jgi:putative ABC transport system ATP-binding protein
MTPAPAVLLENLRFGYKPGRDILDVPSLAIPPREKVFLFGPSGSGKTTLLGVVAGVLEARAGAVRVLGEDLRALSGARRDALRGARMGYIFQLFNLLPYLSVMDNITLPCRLHPARAARLNGESPERAAQALAAQLDIAALLREPARELSVGQQQRVAAARALLGNPDLVIADEPTSALDAGHRAQFLKILFECCERAGAALLFVSHDRSLEPLFDRALSLPALQRRAA